VTLLLDTHAFLWFCQDDPLLSATAKALIEDANNRKLLSVASCWEIAIKSRASKAEAGRTKCRLHPRRPLPNGNRAPADFVGPRDRRGVITAPPPRSFRPAARPQSTIEAIPVVSVDLSLDPYGVSRLW